jgi:hypothetical protein
MCSMNGIFTYISMTFARTKAPRHVGKCTIHGAKKGGWDGDTPIPCHFSLRGPGPKVLLKDSRGRFPWRVLRRDGTRFFCQTSRPLPQAPSCVCLKLNASERFLDRFIANQPDTLQKMDQILCWLISRYSH